jgi:hypothetical protein
MEGPAWASTDEAAQLARKALLKRLFRSSEEM